MIHCKRYLAAAGDYYYPHTGFGNIKGLFDSVDEAMRVVRDERTVDYDWVSVYDLLTQTVVAYEDWAFVEGGWRWVPNPDEVAE